MKLLFGLLMLVGVLFANDSFAERRCFGGGGWSAPVYSGSYGGSCGGGYYGGGWVECGSPVVYSSPVIYSSPVYYSPSCSSTTVVYRSAAPRRVMIDGEVWTLVEGGYPSYEQVQPRYNVPSQQNVASPQRQVQQNYEEIPVMPTPAPKQKPQRDLLTNPSRNEAPPSRYNDVEFFKAPKR